MGNLSKKTPQSTYGDLLQVQSDSNTGLSAAFQPVEDGKGNKSHLQLSTVGVNIASGFYLGGNAVNVTAGDLNKLAGLTGYLLDTTTGYTKLQVNALIDDLSGVTDQITARTNLGLGTTDSPTFAGLMSTGDLVVDTDDFFVDASANKVLIGTSVNPQGRLTIKETSGSAGLAITDGTVAWKFTNGDPGAYDLSLKHNAGVGGQIFTLGTKTGGGISLVVDGSGDFDLQSGNITTTGDVNAANVYITGELQGNVGLSASTGGSVTINTNVFRPYFGDDGLIDLGASNARWKNLNLSGVVDAGGMIRAQGAVSPSSGAGLEMLWNGTKGLLFPYDRTTPSYKPMEIRGSTIELNPNGGVGIYLDGSGQTHLNGSFPAIYGDDNDGILTLTPTTSTISGANIRLFGSSHATQANDIQLRADTSTKLAWDHSASEWLSIGNFKIDPAGVGYSVNGNAQELAVMGAGNVGINILSDGSANGYLLFGTNSDSSRGGVFYDYVNNLLSLNANDNSALSVGDQGSGTKITKIYDGTAPTANPTGGGYMYSVAGALYWRGSSGTVTNIAAA